MGKGASIFWAVLVMSWLMPGTSFVLAQEQWFEVPLSDRIASYDIEVKLDTELHRLTASQTIYWQNSSDDTIRTIPFHLYLNAFKNTESTFYRESLGSGRFPDLENTTEADWGWINIDKIKIGDGEDLSRQLRYIHPDDDNTEDKTVIELVLLQPILPRAKAVLKLTWTAKIPKIKIRTGYSKDFYLQAQWFPKIGVYESAGMRFAKTGQWNCHQYHPTTEYYANFGNYNVSINAPNAFIVGALGTRTKVEKQSDQTFTHHFHGEDIIDFTWTASPKFEVVKETHLGIKLELLINSEYSCCTDRYLESAKHAIDYLGERLMPYPFPKLTIVVPPLHGINAGAMEYPTLVTAPGMYGFPDWLRSPEYFVVHEFVHQYFMMMVATNEFEEAWMDEGFTSYWKSRILDDAYGVKNSVIDLRWVRMGAMEFFRSRYVGMDNIHLAESTRAGWEYPNGSPRALFYSKPATWLKTLEGIVGLETMDEIMKTYFNRWKFKHPCRYDFIDVVNEVVVEKHGDEFGENMNWFFDFVLYGTGACDYSVGSIQHLETAMATIGIWEDSLIIKNQNPQKKYQARVVLERLEEIQLPVDILVCFVDGTKVWERWDGKARTHGLTYDTDVRIDYVEIDPLQKIYMDINILNNSKRTEPNTRSIWAYVSSWGMRIQQVFQGVSFFI